MRHGIDRLGGVRRGCKPKAQGGDRDFRQQTARETYHGKSGRPPRAGREPCPLSFFPSMRVKLLGWLFVVAGLFVFTRGTGWHFSWMLTGAALAFPGLLLVTPRRLRPKAPERLRVK